MLSERIGKIVVEGLVVVAHIYVGLEKLGKKYCSFGLREWFLEPIPVETSEETGNLWFDLEEAESPEDLQLVWERAISGGYVEAEAWRRLWATSETCNQWRWIWKRTTDRKEKDRAWENVKEKVGDLLSKPTVEKGSYPPLV